MIRQNTPKLIIVAPLISLEVVLEKKGAELSTEFAMYDKRDGDFSEQIFHHHISNRAKNATSLGKLLPTRFKNQCQETAI